MGYHVRGTIDYSGIRFRQVSFVGWAVGRAAQQRRPTAVEAQESII